MTQFEKGQTVRNTKSGGQGIVVGTHREREGGRLVVEVLPLSNMRPAFWRAVNTEAE